MTKEVLFNIAYDCLLEASKQMEKLGSLWSENQFRYLVMNKLSREGTFGKIGYKSNWHIERSLILECKYKKSTRANPSRIDLVSLKKESLHDPSHKKYWPQPLAVELKINHASDVRKDLLDCRNYLSDKGSIRFQWAMLLVASKKRPLYARPHSRTGSKLLLGYLDEWGDPILEWVTP